MKFTKRIATILMALAMMLCLTVPAFAAEPAAQARLTVSGDQLKGKTVYATKMFTASWVDSNNNGKIDKEEQTPDKVSYTLDSEWEGLFWANNLSTGTSCPEGSVNVNDKEGATLNEKAVAYLTALTEDSTDLISFAAKAAKYKTAHSIADTKIATGGDDNTATFDQLVPGYYLVQPDKGSTSATRKTDAMLVNVPSDKAATLQLKSEYPSVVKKVDTDKTESSAQIGQKVSFTLTSKVPDMTDYDTYYFAFKDTMSKGLTFDKDSVEVTIGGNKLEANAIKVESTPDADTGATNITIEILNMKTAGTAKYTAGADIKVTYSATLNKDAVVGNTGNTNSATVEYQNGPATNDHGTSNPSTTTTRTYEIKVHKHAFDSTVDTSVLAGAKFALSTSEKTPVFNKVDDRYTLDNSEANKEANGAVIPLVGTDATGYRVAEKNGDGTVNYFTTVAEKATTIEGLKAGTTYYLHEIEAPKGYNKLTAPVEVTITETKDGTNGNVTSVTYTVDKDDQGRNPTIKVVNKTGSMLPSTGGMGTIGLTALGVGVVALGVLAPKKKKEKQ